MKITQRTWAYGLLAFVFAVLGLIFYASWEILTPFITAAIFAYILNPIVSLLAARTHLPRSAAILIVYVVIVSLIVMLGVYVGSRVVAETREFASEARVILFDIETGRAELPSWLEPYTGGISQAIRSSVVLSSQQIVRFFSGALSSVLNLFIFMMALFYFLKEGGEFVERLQRLLPKDKKEQLLLALTKVNRVLTNYFLAQFSLVIFMATVSSIVFALLGVKYALILGIVVGLAELVPVVGPTIGFVTVVFVSGIGGGAGTLNLPVYYEPLIVGLVYVLINQIENIFIVPQVTGRMVELHPLLIIASVLIGGHLFGALGFLVAVPLVASVKVVLQHVWALLVD